MLVNGDPEAGHPERLRAELSSRGIRSQVITSTCKPRLRIHVPGPHGGADAEFEDNIVAAAGPDGHWTYFWPWVEEICAADDPVRAAQVIVTTLGLEKGQLLRRTVEALVAVGCQCDSVTLICVDRRRQIRRGRRAVRGGRW